MCFENKIHALLKKYIIKKESLYWCVGFLIWGLYIPAASSATSPAVRTLLIWLFYITHITHLTYSLTYTHIHIYTHSLTLTHTYLHTLTLTYLLTHSLTYLYLLKNTHTHSLILAYIHTHIHSIPPFFVWQPFAIYIPNDPNALAPIGVRFLCVEGVG
jgi:hypothetical protein